MSECLRKRAAVVWAKSTNFDFGSPLHGSAARTFKTWLPVNGSGIKLTSALAPSEISEPHEALHFELPPAVAFWSLDDRAAMSMKQEQCTGCPFLVRCKDLGPKMLRMAVAKQLLIEQQFA